MHLDYTRKLKKCLNRNVEMGIKSVLDSRQDDIIKGKDDIIKGEAGPTSGSSQLYFPI